MQPSPIPPGQEGSDLVEAQFDPTNPIPVLTLIPTPTVLAQNPDGTLNQDAVRPEDCERPTTAQCLAFVEGWPTTTPITLFFSGEIDRATLAEGVLLYEVDSATNMMTQVALDVENAVFVPRAPPGPDLTVDPTRSANDCNTEFGYSDGDITPGFDLIIAPAEDQNPFTPGLVDLKFNTQYVVLVRSDAQGGLRDADNDPVEPSGLFFTLNVDDPPVAQDGTILSALLRSQVQNGVLDAAFGGRLLEDLNEQERAALDAQVQTTGQSIVPLYAVFNGVVQLASANGLISNRNDFIFVNTWNTGGPPRPGPVFDPTTGAVPFPNSELLLTVNADGNRRVNIPDIEGSPIPSAALPGVNKLDGFSLRVPSIGPLPETGPIIQFSMQAPVDVTTIADSIVMYPLDDTGAPMDAIAVNARPTSTTTPDTLILQPLLPLQPDTTYVIGVTRDLKQASGADFGSASAFELLKTPAPLIAEGTV
ncbi:MAG: hypothetical protein AAFV29_05585, partial [Myxococcota bacterium]